MEALDVAVVVPTRRRPLRLRWLLNALEESELPRSRFEVLVGFDADDHATRAVLEAHPLRPRPVEVLAGSGPATKREACRRAARAPLIAFTDDDCRPPAAWLRALVDAAARHPGAIVQGATRPDPDELGILHHAPHARSQHIDPPHVMAQTCNIAYPRAVLEAVGGFDERFVTAAGEDADVALRARAHGVPVVAAPEALTYHAVESGLVSRLRGAWRWQHMPLLVREHPELRRELPLRGWAWKAEHARWALAAMGVCAARRRRRRGRGALALAAPWVLGAPRPYGTSPRALARAASELPGQFVLDGVETAALVSGSLRYRTPLL